MEISRTSFFNDIRLFFIASTVEKTNKVSVMLYCTRSFKMTKGKYHTQASMTYFVLYRDLLLSSAYSISQFMLVETTLSSNTVL
jgi:hypothetical protein